VKEEQMKTRVVRASAVLCLTVVLGSTVAASAGAGSASDGDGRAAEGRPLSRTVSRGPSIPRAAGLEGPTLEQGTLTIEGTLANDTVVLRLKAGAPGVLQIDVDNDGSADFRFRRERVQRIAIGSRGGADLVRIDESNGVFTDEISTTIDGSGGSDTLVGGTGTERLLGGGGKDSVDGNGGNDRAFMGAGSDLFVWDPGDGSDVVEGQDGSDTMLFNGADVGERVDLSANGARLTFSRDLGNITMDTAGLERVDFTALGGADLVTVNDLTGTDVLSVNVDLAGTLGGSGDDGQSDSVIVNGTNGEDSITASADGGGVKVSGLVTTIGVVHSDAVDDRLEINTLEGRDIVIFELVVADVIQLFVDGVPAA
jgi:hypothetical protein